MTKHSPAPLEALPVDDGSGRTDYMAPSPSTAGNGPKYPDIHVKFVGTDGNAFALMGKVRQALRRAGKPQADLDAFFNEATAGDYDNLLNVCCRWVDVS